MEIGDEVTMEFHFAGEVSEEDCKVTEKSAESVTLDNDYEFSLIDGHCLNDNDFMGAKRVLKLEEATA